MGLSPGACALCTSHLLPQHAALREAAIFGEAKLVTLPGPARDPPPAHVADQLSCCSAAGRHPASLGADAGSLLSGFVAPARHRCKRTSEGRTGDPEESSGRGGGGGLWRRKGQTRGQEVGKEESQRGQDVLAEQCEDEGKGRKAGAR